MHAGSAAVTSSPETCQGVGKAHDIDRMKMVVAARRTDGGWTWRCRVRKGDTKRRKKLVTLFGVTVGTIVGYRSEGMGQTQSIKLDHVTWPQPRSCPKNPRATQHLYTHIQCIRFRKVVSNDHKCKKMTLFYEILFNLKDHAEYSKHKQAMSCQSNETLARYCVVVGTFSGPSFFDPRLCSLTISELKNCLR
jgi:hypothetical protein